MAAPLNTAPSWAGADFVQWHGNYPMLRKKIELETDGRRIKERKCQEVDSRQWLRPGILLEIFVLLNLGFLTFDIYLAHSVNDFRQRAEYIPLYFSALAPVLLLAGLAFQSKRPLMWKAIGHVVGWSAILIGLTGVILHLDSSFFYERTIRSLTYSAPFAAPLAYTGLGFLLLLNRLQEPSSEEWARWVLFLALGGFIGNFVFSLTDHAGKWLLRPVGMGPGCG